MRHYSGLNYLITGVTGQDGFFSARHFLKNGATVVGVSRRPLSKGGPHIDLLCKYPRFRYIHFPEYTSSAIARLVSETKPDRILHCAGFRDIPTTEDEVSQCFHTNCDILEMLVRAVVRSAPASRLLFLSSAEIFSRDTQAPLSENSFVAPKNQYGVSKVRGMEIINHFRITKGIFAVSAICFNHDSCLSPPTHLVRLVPRKLLMLKNGIIPIARFYDTLIQRDWSHAKDFVQAFDLMLEQPIPEDLIIASGVSTTLQEYIDISCDFLGIDGRESLIFESGQDGNTYDRIANPARLKTKLGWKPGFDIRAICKEMIRWETRAYQKHAQDKVPGQQNHTDLAL